MRLHRNIHFLLLSLTCLVFVSDLQAQREASLEPVINQIKVKFQGFQPVSDQYVRGNVQLRTGMNYNSTLVDQSIRSLYATNQFEYIEVKVEQADEGKVDVIFIIIPKYTIGKIEFNGNNKFSPERLSSKGEIDSGIPLDEYLVSQAAEKIQEYFVEKHYPDALVDYRISKNDETGYATVTYDIESGDKVKIAEIKFTGVTAFSAKKLRKQLETRQTNWISWMTSAGTYDESVFNDDLDLLRTYYRNNGYLDVEIDVDQVEIDKISPKRIAINIPIDEGQCYYIGDLSVNDNTIFTEDELLQNITIESGEPFSPEDVDDASTIVRDYYTSRGYLEAFVRAERVPNMDTRRIDVVFRIRESEKFYVESINVEGNTKTKTRVILRELALRPGDIFDLKRLETSELRLKNTQFFDDVRLNPEATNVPGRKDLGVTVREGRTGSFSFGAGFGSVQSAMIFFELTQGNFDLFNWRNGLQGDGQKMRIRGSFGSLSNEMVISFEEPWLFEQRLAFGFDLFRRESDYVSSEYNELRTGFELYLRRRLFELVEARMSYRLEVVEIFDVAGLPGIQVDDNIPDIFEEAEGKEVVSKVGVTLLRDTRNSLLFTTKGNRTTLSTQWAGVGGDVNYIKVEGRMAHFIPTFESLEQTLAIFARAGTVIPYGDTSSIPFYDRFYLGGPETLRGYDYRDIGPREAVSDEAIGGNTYSMLSLEYIFRIAEPLGLAVFYDCGFVNSKELDFSPSNYADNWGVGARLMMMGSPLKLDLGFPITDPTGKASGSQFNFSFGTRF